MTLLGSISNAGNIKDKIRLEKEAYDKLKTDIDPEMLKKKIEEMNNTTSISMA